MGCPPAPVYKGARGRGRPALFGRAKGSPTPTGSRIPPFLVQLGQGGKEGKRGRGEGRETGAAPQTPCPIRAGLGRGARHLLVLPTKAHQGPLLLPRIPVTPRYLRKYPNHSEPFRCPNIVIQYIDLYVSTISRLLVMSLISSGTPNSFGTSKLINS